MRVYSTMNAGVLVVKVTGCFDFSLHTEFREAIKLAEQGVKGIEIDLCATTYMDSSALGMLLVMRDKFPGDKNTMQIKNAQNDVKKILEIANFQKLFTLS